MNLEHIDNEYLSIQINQLQTLYTNSLIEIKKQKSNIKKLNKLLEEKSCFKCREKNWKGNSVCCRCNKQFDVWVEKGIHHPAICRKCFI
jgi:dynactin complex subunit